MGQWLEEQILEGWPVVMEAAGLHELPVSIFPASVAGNAKVFWREVHAIVPVALVRSTRLQRFGNHRLENRRLLVRQNLVVSALLKAFHALVEDVVGLEEADKVGKEDGCQCASVTPWGA